MLRIHNAHGKNILKIIGHRHQGFLINFDNLWTAVSSPDGRGSTPGYHIGEYQAFSNKNSFCKIINEDRFYQYNDNAHLTGQCQGCAEGVRDVRPGAPSSLLRRSGAGGQSVLSQLKGFLRWPF